MTRQEQRTAALDIGNEVRMERARLRRDLVSGKRDWRQVILDPPECVHDMLMVELLLMFPKVQRVKVETLGRQAFGAGLTLTVRVGNSSQRTRRWLVENVLPTPARSGRRARVHSAQRGGMAKGVLLS